MKSGLRLFLLALTAITVRACAAEGDWVSLFNGTNLSGWTVQCQTQDQGKNFWRIEEG